MIPYKLIDLGALVPNGLNNGTDIVGSLTPPGHATLYSGGSLTDLGALAGATSSTASAINDDGLIVGGSNVGGTGRAFIYDGSLRDLGAILNARYSAAYDVSNNGKVVGGAAQPGSPEHAFLYDHADGTVTDLGTLAGYEQSRAFGINISGDVVGASSKSASIMIGNPFLYSQGAMQHLLINDYGTAYDINDGGQIVGGAHKAGAFLIDNGQVNHLPVDGILYSINNAGEIVGQTFGAQGFGFLVRDGAVIDLNTWSPPGWHVTSATHINDNSEIVGSALFNGQPHGILLSPVSVVGPFHPFSVDISVAELSAHILFGVTQDGQGVIWRPSGPTPIGPWGPFWERFVRSNPDAVVSLAILGLAARLEDGQTGAELQQRALAVVRSAIADL